jgi:hypothetical protein
MDRLQITFAPTRVEQKNLAQLLKSWQIGQLVTARVIDKSSAGNLLLQVGAHKISAAADTAVSKGSVLLLEVSSLAPAPSLKIVTTSGLAHSAALASPLQGQLQVLLPRQGNVVTPLLTLFNPAQSANIMSLLGMKRDELDRLYKHLAPLHQLADPKLLHGAVLRSGLFLESQLLSVLNAGGLLSQGDIKGLLFRLQQRIESALARHRASGSEGKGAVLILETLHDEVKGALATITLNQLSVTQKNEKDAHTWLFDMPFRLGDAVLSLSIVMVRENDAGAEGTEPQAWKILLSLTLPGKGEIEADLFLNGTKVSVVMFVEHSETASMINLLLPQLRTALERHELDVSVLLCHQGNRAPADINTLWSLSVDEQV